MFEENRTFPSAGLWPAGRRSRVSFSFAHQLNKASSMNYHSSITWSRASERSLWWASEVWERGRVYWLWLGSRAALRPGQAGAPKIRGGGGRKRPNMAASHFTRRHLGDSALTCSTCRLQPASLSTRLIKPPDAAGSYKSFILDRRNKKT